MAAARRVLAGVFRPARRTQMRRMLERPADAESERLALRIPGRVAARLVPRLRVVRTRAGIEIAANVAVRLGCGRKWSIRARGLQISAWSRRRRIRVRPFERIRTFNCGRNHAKRQSYGRNTHCILCRQATQTDLRNTAANLFCDSKTSVSMTAPHNTLERWRSHRTQQRKETMRPTTHCRAAFVRGLIRETRISQSGPRRRSETNQRRATHRNQLMPGVPR